MKDIILTATGILTGRTLGGPAAHAVATALTDAPSTQNFYVDVQKVKFTAYAIGGNNYVKLRDVRRAVDFGVTCGSVLDSVYIDPDAHYEVELPAQSGRQDEWFPYPSVARNPQVFWTWQYGQIGKIFSSSPYRLYSMRVWAVYQKAGSCAPNTKSQSTESIDSRQGSAACVWRFSLLLFPRSKTAVL